MGLRRSSASPSAGVATPFLQRGFFLERYPYVLDFLSLQEWEDGAARQVGSLTLFVDMGRLKVCVNDKDGSRVAFVTGGSLEDLLGLLETGLEHDSLDWRPVRPVAGKRPAK